MTRGKPN